MMILLYDDMNPLIKIKLESVENIQLYIIKC